MGSFASKIDLKDPASVQTPKSSKILPFDPRSPSTNVSRTPIAVTNTPSSSDTPKIMKPLPNDPRSPTTEMTRTPLLVEESLPSTRKYQPQKLSNLIVEHAIDENDPRSPTTTVPRTPVEEQPKYETPLDTPTGPPKLKKMFPESSNEKRPLAIQNCTPREKMKAMQCRNVEEEFSKNEQRLMTQLELDAIKTNTDFVQDI